MFKLKIHIIMQKGAETQNKISSLAFFEKGPTTDFHEMSKRKRPDPTTSQLVSKQEETLYSLIKSKEDMGIWSRDIKRESNLPDNIVTKCLKTLLSKKLIKEVANIQFKGKKFYMAVEFEPSSEVTGGAWYSEGSLDTEFINLLKYQCVSHISKRKVATIDDITEDIVKSKLFKQEYSSQKVGEILRTLVLDNEVFEVKSTGIGEFASIRAGTVCYRCKKQQGGSAKAPKVEAMASIPCGVCPRINECTPDGIISPMTCEYYTKWLDF